MPDVTFEPGWLQRELDRAREEIARGPKWLREWRLPPEEKDPCRCPRRCDEAQTCVGGCVYQRSPPT